VENIFPLLDPDIKSFDEKVEKHVLWWKDCPALLDPEEEGELGQSNPFNQELETKGTIDQFMELVPVTMTYIPSKKVFQKLIKFATMVEDPLTEFNNKEEKTDPRTRKEGTDHEPQGV